MLLNLKSLGFTLVEVMVSMVIFLAASIGLLALLLANLQANQNNTLLAQARRLANSTMTEMQREDFATLRSLSGNTLLIGDIEIQRQVDLHMQRPEQYRITVTAHWQQKDRSHRYQLQTLRSAP